MKGEDADELLTALTNAADNLVATLEQYRRKPSGPYEQRDIAINAVAAFAQFLETIQRAPDPVMDALVGLMAALDAVDRGERHPLLKSERAKGSRPSPPFDQRIRQVLLQEA